MDFDHRDSMLKSFRLTSGAAMLMPLARLEAEAEKCDVVCANCHRVRTRQRASIASPAAAGTSPYLPRRRTAWRAQAAVLRQLRDRPCLDCGGRYPPVAMDFDHRDPRTKSQSVTRMVGRAGLDRILEEVSKCDIVCANCHRLRTARRFSERE